MQNIETNKPQQTKEVLLTDSSTQHFEELETLNTEFEFDKYIESLHRVIKGINHMHIGKIINKLNDLSNSLKTIEIPSPCSSPDITELNFTDTIKSIHTKLRVNIHKKNTQKVEKNIPKPKLKENKETSTILKIEEIKLMESYKILLTEKDTKIIDLQAQLLRKDEVEELFVRKSKECEDLKQSLAEILATGCVQCKARKQQLTSTQAEIKNMQISVCKSINIEKELEQTKNKLKDSITTITVKNVKIQELTENLEDLAKKIEETKLQREELMEKLMNEEKLRNNVENLLSKEIENTVQLKKKILNKNSVNELAKNLKKSPDKIVENVRTESPVISCTIINKGNPRTPSNIHEDSWIQSSPDTKRTGSNRKLVSKYSDILTSSTKSYKKLKEGMKIMEVLKMTKEEYLALSKKTRMELFDCLFQHKEKCGADCEHLKRAMKIKYKDKGLVFPTKKYNIT